jgi:hypothetical protein
LQKKTCGEPQVFIKIGGKKSQREAFSFEPGLNFTDLDALILIFSPV